MVDGWDDCTELGGRELADELRIERGLSSLAQDHGLALLPVFEDQRAIGAETVLGDIQLEAVGTELLPRSPAPVEQVDGWAIQQSNSTLDLHNDLGAVIATAVHNGTQAIGLVTAYHLQLTIPKDGQYLVRELHRIPLGTSV
jgi:hypothetical protein